MRDLLAQWAAEEPKQASEDTLPVVYNDQVLSDLLSAFESLSVVASDSREHQILTEILNALSTQYQRLPDDWLPQVDETITRVLSTLEYHILTRNLLSSVVSLIANLEQTGKLGLARLARDRLNRMHERLQSHSSYSME